MSDWLGIRIAKISVGNAREMDGCLSYLRYDYLNPSLLGSSCNHMIAIHIIILKAMYRRR